MRLSRPAPHQARAAVAWSPPGPTSPSHPPVHARRRRAPLPRRQGHHLSLAAAAATNGEPGEPPATDDAAPAPADPDLEALVSDGTVVLTALEKALIPSVDPAAEPAAFLDEAATAFAAWPPFAARLAASPSRDAAWAALRRATAAWGDFPDASSLSAAVAWAASALEASAEPAALAALDAAAAKAAKEAAAAAAAAAGPPKHPLGLHPTVAAAEWASSALSWAAGTLEGEWEAGDEATATAHTLLAEAAAEFATAAAAAAAPSVRRRAKAALREQDPAALARMQRSEPHTAAVLIALIAMNTLPSAIHDRGVIALLIHKLAALPRAAAARAAAKAARARDPAKAGRGAKERPLAAEVTPYERGRRFLKPGEVLRAGEALTSVDCKSKLVLQADGNLVLYTHDTRGAEAVAWSTGTAGTATPATPAKLGLGRDGNILLTSVEGSTLWSSGTGGAGARRGPASANAAGLYLAVDDGGVARLMDPSGACVWHTGGSVASQAGRAVGGLVDVARQGLSSGAAAVGRGLGWAWGLVPGRRGGGGGGGCVVGTEGSEAGGGGGGAA